MSGKKREYTMRKYVLGFLYRGPHPEADPEKAEALQSGHMENIGRLVEEGKLILAGPIADKGDMRGIFLFDTESVEDARAWCDTDPAVIAGVLRVELKPWLSAKGIGIHDEAGSPAAPTGAAEKRAP